MKTIEERAYAQYPTNSLEDVVGRQIYTNICEEQKVIDKRKAHEAFVELLLTQYGESCDESMHQYIDNALNIAIEGK